MVRTAIVLSVMMAALVLVTSVAIGVVLWRLAVRILR